MEGKKKKKEIFPNTWDRPVLTPAAVKHKTESVRNVLSQLCLHDTKNCCTAAYA